MAEQPSRVRPRYDHGLAVYHRAPTAPSSGSAPRVVYVHGAMDRAASFIRTVRRRPELDVVRYDRRGYARSVAAGVCRGLDDHIDDLLRVVDGRPSVVVGHSLGGVIALAAARRHPDLVLGVGAFEAPLWTSDASTSAADRDRADADARRDPALAAEQFLRRMIGDDGWSALPEATRRARRSEGPALVSDLAAVRAASHLDVAALTVPVVAGRGGASSDRHRRSAAVLAHDAPLAELVTIDGAGHDAHRTHPDDFARFVDRAVELSVGRSVGEPDRARIGR